MNLLNSILKLFVVEIIRLVTGWIDKLYNRWREQREVSRRVEEAAIHEESVKNADNLDDKISKTRDFLNKK